TIHRRSGPASSWQNPVQSSLVHELAYAVGAFRVSLNRFLMKESLRTVTLVDTPVGKRILRPEDCYVLGALTGLRERYKCRPQLINMLLVFPPQTTSWRKSPRVQGRHHCLQPAFCAQPVEIVCVRQAMILISGISHPSGEPPGSFCLQFFSTIGGSERRVANPRESRL